MRLCAADVVGVVTTKVQDAVVSLIRDLQLVNAFDNIFKHLRFGERFGNNSIPSSLDRQEVESRHL